MFRIRQVYDDTLLINKQAIEQVQRILRAQFSDIREEKVRSLTEQLRNPLKYRFRTILFVADDSRGNVKGFALLSHEPLLDFCYLDYMATATGGTSHGVGGALYERVRQEARFLKVVGLFFECLPDDPLLCPDRDVLKQNAARLRFYEKYGAKPIANTAYETPVAPEDDNPPYLVFDDLGIHRPLRRKKARAIVRAILERKYGDVCPEQYIRKVVESFRDNPVRIREPRYIKKAAFVEKLSVPADRLISLVVNDRHAIHHVRSRGYVESPVRIGAILRELRLSGLFREIRPRRFSEALLKTTHDADYVAYFKQVCASVGKTDSIYPYVFPIRNEKRPPRELAIRAGYYCIDTFTPINHNAFMAAKRSVDCALTAACELLEGRRCAYALVRPPGHHAERRAFGGFCYFNSAAIAAEFLSEHGRVAMLDIDHHHGNGQQQIFYRRRDVLTVSIHGHPNFTYPYFSGFRDEIGEDDGKGFNVNIPLDRMVMGAEYREKLAKALGHIVRFRPAFLIVLFGLDVAHGDPTGTWELGGEDLERNGYLIGEARHPLLVIQEGGYHTPTMGQNARRFFKGLWAGLNGLQPAREVPPADSGQGTADTLSLSDQG